MSKNKLSNELYTNDNGEVYSRDSLCTGLHNFINVESYDGSFLDDTGLTSSSLEPGIFKRNPEGFNIAAACNWLHKNAGAGAKHVCAKYVRMALEAGGINTSTRPTWAWKYINWLPTVGFKMIGKISRSSGFSPEPGDIAVYQQGNNPSVPGHICMWTGAEWASDFKQKSAFVYSSTNEAYIFRFV